jgi:hypothetical protein
MLRLVNFKIVADVSEQYVWRRIGKLTGFWWGNTKDKGHLEDLGVDGRIILKLKYHVMYLASLMRLRTGIIGGCCDQGNISLGSIKCGELLDRLSHTVTYASE